MKTVSKAEDITVIGLGAMGTALAKAFLENGHKTIVWNRSPEKADPLVAAGAVKADTVEEAVSASQLIVVCVTGYKDALEVLDPIKRHLSTKVLVNLSSGTYDQALKMKGWAETLGLNYISGAAMSGIRLVGNPDALFLYGGSPEAFEVHQPTLKALGKALHLGENPGITSVYDMALFGMAWGALSGFYHATALVEGSGVKAREFASVATSHLPFIASLMADHAGQIDNSEYPDDDGTLEVHEAAMKHLVQSSLDQGINTDFPVYIQKNLKQAVAAGYSRDGIASAVEVIRNKTML